MEKKECFFVKEIIEPDYGCEERMEGQEKICKVILNGAEEIMVDVPDAWLYKEEINEGDAVFWDEEGNLRNYKKSNGRNC